MNKIDVSLLTKLFYVVCCVYLVIDFNREPGVTELFLFHGYELLRTIFAFSVLIIAFLIMVDAMLNTKKKFKWGFIFVFLTLIAPWWYFYSDDRNRDL